MLIAAPRSRSPNAFIPLLITPSHSAGDFADYGTEIQISDFAKGSVRCRARARARARAGARAIGLGLGP